VGERW